MNMKLSRSKLITINAALCALVMLFVIIPISLGPLQLAFIPIIAVIVSAQFLGLKNSLFTGLFFGVVSLVNHFIRPGLLSPMFYNPAISILPRVLIGVASYYATKGIRKIAPKLPDIFAYGAGAIAGVLTNTIGVLGLLLAFYYGRPIGSTAITFNWVAGVIVSNSILEIILCAVITPPVVVALKAAFKNMSPAKTAAAVQKEEFSVEVSVITKIEENSVESSVAAESNGSSVETSASKVKDISVENSVATKVKGSRVENSDSEKGSDSENK